MFATIGYWICVPFAALVRLFYNLTGSYGMAIILFTLAIKLILLPFQMKSKKSMLRMSRMSGRIQEIQKKYANNPAKMNEEMQKFYAEEGANPMSGCLWSFLPLPILMALYSIIRQPITHFMTLGQDVVYQLVDAVSNAGIDMSAIVQMRDGVMVMEDGLPQLMPYGQIHLVNAVQTHLPEAISGIDGWIDMNYQFIGLDLAAQPSSAFTNFQFSWAVIGLILIPILAGGAQLLFSWITMKSQPQQGAGASQMRMMMIIMPLFSIYIAFTLPAALGLYWIAQSLFSLVQETLMNKFYTKRLKEEEDAKFEAREADRKRRMEEAKKLQEEQRQQAAQKQTLKEKRKAAQEAKSKKAKKAASSTTEAGRVGDRPYARGRSYREDRYESETK